MKRVRLTIAYDGTNYCGWQSQPNGITIEEVLDRELERLLGEPVQVIGASRTDSGVHALGNIAVFDTSARMPADKIAIALNQRLPQDIVIQKSEEVPLSWHPRKVNSHKTYEYRILNRKVPLPSERFNSYFYYYDLDVERMRAGAAFLVGEHDFKSFCSIRTQVEDTVRRIEALDIKKEGDMIRIRITGNGFLYNMVRIIVGSLVKVGCGFWEPERIRDILEARDRSLAGPKAPAHGLTLVSICEDTKLRDLEEESNEHWSYRVCQREIGAFGQAYIEILSCDDRDFLRTLTRLTKHASRNGAEKIHVCDRTGHLAIGTKADYFLFEESYGLWELSKEIGNTDFSDADGFSTDKSLHRSKEIENTDFSEEKEFIFREFSEGEFSQEEKAAWIQMENSWIAAFPQARHLSEEEDIEFSEEKECFFVYRDDSPAGILRYQIVRMQDQKVLWLFADSAIICAEDEKTTEAFLLFAEHCASAQGCTKMTICLSDCLPAFAFLEKHGFQKEKLLSVWYLTWDQKKNQQEEEEE